ncbi:MAG: hypothetical protein ACJ789_06510 [Thermomicrobiales bacterium]
MSVAPRCHERAEAWPRRLCLGLLCLAIVGLTACGGGNNNPATATPAVPTPVASPTATIGPSTPGNFAADATELGKIVWATGIDDTTKAPNDHVSAYSHDAPAIYAVLPVIRLNAKARITAEWDYDGTPMPKVTTIINGSDLPKGGWIEFHLQRATNLFWPVGSYHVRVLVNGQLAQESSIEVKPPSQ